jgi:hypothetical protein
MSDWHSFDEFSAEALSEGRGLIRQGKGRGTSYRQKFVPTPVLEWLGVAFDLRALRAELKYVYPRNQQCRWLYMKLTHALECADPHPVTFNIDDLVLPAERPRLARQQAELRDRTWHRLGFLLSTHSHIDFDALWPPFDGFIVRLVDPSIDVERDAAGYFDAVFGTPYDPGQPPASVTIAFSSAVLAHTEQCRRIAKAARS